jgi:Asp-tRNA(Asn)/Glu-tRNA(Gln) amidotransferase A subunit family amidase
MDSTLTLTLTELIARLRLGKLSPVELMTAVLARIDETNGDLNAVVSMRDREALLADARAAEARIQRGEARPLEGIPLGVKDLEHAAGLPLTFGSLLFKDRVAEKDEAQIARLKAAGAIVVGKTNAPEFGHTAITKNLVYGVTRSPWNLDVTPGGSSGGSAAALAGCVLPLVTASDGGGSIRIPASFVGAYGLKTSYGRIPHDMLELWETGDTAVAGPLTKSVADAALQLDLTCGPHPLDPNSLPHPGISYVEALAEDLPPGTRFGFSPDLGYGVVQSDVAAVVEDAAHAFEKAGHRLVPIAGGPPMLGAAWGMLGAFAQLGRLAQYLPAREHELTRAFLAGIKIGAKLTPERAGEINRLRSQLNAWCADVFSRVDFLITPTVPYDPPPAKGPFPEVTEGRKQPPAGVAAFTIPFNLSWHPAATLRAGLSRRGLPVGVQIVGPRHREDLVLRASLVFERERPWHPHWPTRWEGAGR